MKFKSVLLIFILSLFSIFLIAGIQMNNPYDEGVYYDYTKSIVDDGDFNIINQVRTPEQKWIVSPTYNHPDFHHELPAVLYAPIYSAHKYLNLSATTYNTKIDYALIAFLLFAGMLLLYNDFRKKYPMTKENEIYTLLLFFFGSYVSWNLLFEPSDIDLLVALMSGAISLSFISIFNESASVKKAIGFAFLLGTGICIKTDLFFYAPLGGLVFLLWIKEKKYKESLILMLVFLFSIIPLLINRYLKLGTIFQDAYSGMITPYSFSNFTKLIGPSGLLTDSPFFLIAVIGFFLLLKKEKINILRNPFFYLFLIFLIKVATNEFIIIKYLPTLGDRHYVADWILAIYLCNISLSEWKFKASKIFIIASLITWSLYIKSVYYVYQITNTGRWGLDYFPVTLKQIPKTVNVSKYYFAQVSNAISLYQIGYYSLLLIFMGGIFYLILKKRKVGTIVILSSFFSLTFSNYLHNATNVKAMKDSGFYSSTVVGKGSLLFYDEYMDLFYASARQARAKNEDNYFQNILKLKKNYIERIQSEVIVDPIHFLNNLKQNKPRPSFWQLLYP